MVEIYQDTKCRGIYPPLFTYPEGGSCFSIYQIRWIKNASSISSSETSAKRHATFLSVRKTVNIHGYPWLEILVWVRPRLSKCYEDTVKIQYYFILVCSAVLNLFSLIPWLKVFLVYYFAMQILF